MNEDRSMTIDRPEQRCHGFDMKKLEEEVRMWKEAGYASYHDPISVDVLLDLIDAYRSRPHPRAPEQNDPCYTLCDDCQRHECFEAALCLINRPEKHGYNLRVAKEQAANTATLATLEIVASVINDRITELREAKRQKVSINGTSFVLQDIETTEGDLILLRIRESLRTQSTTAEKQEEQR
jgi:hypothetical protein